MTCCKKVFVAEPSAIPKVHDFVENTLRENGVGGVSTADIVLACDETATNIVEHAFDGAGRSLPWDGAAFGSLKVRGPWVCAKYFNSDETSAHRDPGWFETGDVATIDADGNIQIVDRVKDVIKSGGEWISSIELENVAVAHPAVREAAVIARPDPKWGERPRLVVALKKDQTATKEELRAFYQGKVASWCVPDDVVIVDELPHTATGKLLKSELRRLYGGP